MSTEKKFVFESLQDVKTIGAFLESITEGMTTGKIVLSSSEECIDMYPCGLLHFSIKAKKKGNNNKISLKIEWKDKHPQEKNTLLSVSGYDGQH
jgi:amphi-Trp domain-containing protein